MHVVCKIYRLKLNYIKIVYSFLPLTILDLHDTEVEIGDLDQMTQGQSEAGNKIIQNFLSLNWTEKMCVSGSLPHFEIFGNKLLREKITAFLLLSKSIL